jgi:transposase
MRPANAAQLEGIDTLTATGLVAAVCDTTPFKNARQMAAWLGLVPRLHSSGGKPTLLGIRKGGQPYLRKLLIHGARAVIQWVMHKQDTRAEAETAKSRRRGRKKVQAKCAQWTGEWREAKGSR